MDTSKNISSKTIRDIEGYERKLLKNIFLRTIVDFQTEIILDFKRIHSFLFPSLFSSPSLQSASRLAEKCSLSYQVTECQSAIQARGLLYRKSLGLFQKKMRFLAAPCALLLSIEKKLPCSLASAMASIFSIKSQLNGKRLHKHFSIVGQDDLYIYLLKEDQ